MRALVPLAGLLALASCRSEAPPAPPGRFVFPTEGRVVDLGQNPGAGWTAGSIAPTSLWAAAMPEPGQCVRPLVVLDQREAAEADPGTRLSMRDLEEWERRHGAVPFGAWVALRSGWSARRARADSYQGDGELPSLDRAVLEALQRERGIAGLLVETPRLGGESEAVWQQALAEAKCGLVLGCVRLQELPATGNVIVLAPFPAEWGPAEGGSAKWGRFPIRIYAITSRAIRTTPRW